ncbi:hypothetical protein ACFQ48_20530 [Hymenobacter caeli]|uniref:Uncharacterized protein n=1 Tax=Hymenobacter caeli TaxID=2735894 RepID=A0ABX2FVW0_9BACT|nr:hypothetical protein [Hymenobacter caeli]NRT21353.1 hypothetical protein [Hymenobacter caeli]
MDIAVILIIGISFVAGLFWYQNNIWGPKKKKLLMQHGPLVELEKWQFRAVTNAFAGELVGKAAEVPLAFVGTTGGYATEVSIGWNCRPHILVRLFFEPGSRDYDEIMHAWKVLQAATATQEFRNCFVAPVYVDAELAYNF